MLLNQIHNEDKEDTKNQHSNKNSIFKKVELEIKLNKTPKRTIEQKEKKLDLPYIHLSRELVNHKMAHLHNFCNSLYSNYNDYSRNRNINNTILNIYNSREQMNDILIDSKLKAIEDIKHYFYINKFPNEVNNKKKNLKDLKDLYKRKYATGENIKPLSLKKIDNILNRNNQEDEKFTLITTLNVKKENEEKKDTNKIYHSIDSHTYRNKNKKINFGDYAMNNIKIKHPILYKLNSRNKNNLPNIHRKNKIFNDIIEISNLIPNKTEINNETKINNYGEYMRLKELKILK